MLHLADVAVLILAILWLAEGVDYEVLRNNSGQCYSNRGRGFSYLGFRSIMIMIFQLQL